LGTRSGRQAEPQGEIEPPSASVELTAELFYRTAFRLAYERALRSLGHDAAMDAAQEICFRAHQRILAGEPAPSNVEAWVGSAVRLHTITQYEKERVRQPKMTLWQSLRNRVIRRWTDPAAVLEEKEMEELLTAGLNVLPRETRAAFDLVHVEGLSYAEAAERLGKKQGTIRVQCMNAMRILSARMADHDEGLR
jgi:RNA polymerase sigma factor (sigma-70 family)